MNTIVALALLLAADPPYAIVDTGQVRAYDATREIAYPAAGRPFFGQDAQYAGNAPSYVDNGDGTVTDKVTGLMWQADPGAKMTPQQAAAGAAKCRLGGHKDWRLPTIKELYSLILFFGTDPDPRAGSTAQQVPFIDRRFFKFRYGSADRGERVIDSQFLSATRYRSTTMRGDETVFGVNFADGRIKGYGVRDPRTRKAKTFYVLYVRGNKKYGRNEFRDNGDGTVTDRATGLTWMQADRGPLDWQQALAFAEGLTFAGKSDWRLPNAKELQSIVDYTRCPDATNSAAIDPVFQVSTIRGEGGDGDAAYPFYWTSTTHASLTRGSTAVYVAFGESPGWMRGRLLDVHGAGSQRSDPKSGDPKKFPRGRGPQGDVIRIYNYVRCVRGGVAVPNEKGPAVRKDADVPGKPADRFIGRLDRNKDGKVSKDEFDGPPQHFRRFDKNNDGFIDASEAPTGPPPGRSGR